jgi:hypothetical protein
MTAPAPDDSPTEVLPRGRTGRHSRPRPTAAQVVARLRAQLPFLVVMFVAAVAFLRIAQQHWREGTTELGLALLLAAVLRATVSDRLAGLLAVRTRRVDIVTYAVFGAIVIAVSLTITGGPFAGR